MQARSSEYNQDSRFSSPIFKHSNANPYWPHHGKSRGSQQFGRKFKAGKQEKKSLRPSQAELDLFQYAPETSPPSFGITNISLKGHSDGSEVLSLIPLFNNISRVEENKQWVTWVIAGNFPQALKNSLRWESNFNCASSRIIHTRNVEHASEVFSRALANGLSQTVILCVEDKDANEKNDSNCNNGDIFGGAGTALKWSDAAKTGQCQGYVIHRT